MITFEDVHKTFHTKEGSVAAVKALDLQVPVGTFFTILGPSGCGKTTTMRMLAGLERPDAGRITIGDRTVFSSTDGINVSAHQREISMVFQSYAIWPHMTVFNNVAYPLRVRKLPRLDIKDRVERILELVGLGGMGSRQATRLSGGQQQRVALARALVPDPAVLLLDEPLSNLDAKLRAQMRSELKDLQKRVGVTTVYVTHDQQEALAMSDELIVMNAGEVVQRGTPEDVYHRPRTRFTAAFIGMTNLLPGTSSEPLREGVSELETPVGRLQAFVTAPMEPRRRTFLVSVRPEALSMTAANTSRAPDNVGSSNVLFGQIENVSFLGDSTTCEVRIADTVVLVKGVGASPLSPGTEVRLEAPPESCIVLMEEPGEDGEPAGSSPRQPQRAGTGTPLR